MRDISLVPELAPLGSELLARGDLLWREGHADDSLRAYTAELESASADHFTRSMAHKRIVSLLLATRGPDAALERYRLTRVDDRELSIAPAEIVCCMTVRNEVDRLPFFLAYYQRLGVDRFLIVDNESGDGTRNLLLGQPNVHLWSSDMPYAVANNGMAWVEVLLNAYARDHWCVVVDADEYLYYPEIETRPLRVVCDAFDREGTVALPVVLLDMYSEGPIRDANCRADQDPLDVCPFFDRDFFHASLEQATPWANIDGFWGGVRRRAFGEESNVFLSKVPLVRYTEERLMLSGAHGTNAPPENVARERGALLHFKFTSRFVRDFDEEIRARSEWGAQGESYSAYAHVLEEQPDLALYDPQHSVELLDSNQLVEVGVMRDFAPTLDEYLAHMNELVPGWFAGIDAYLFRAVDAAQRASGISGDLLELGVFLGKSAIALGYLLRPDEELVAWDLFSGDLVADEPDAEFYRELTQNAFEDNYRRFHRRPATTIARSSTELPAARLGRRFRMIHVDGSHQYEIARQDIAAALDLLVDGGVLVADDYRSMPHALGVAAAVWEAVTDGRLVPFLASDNKFYGFATGREGPTRQELDPIASEGAPLPRVDQDVAGHRVMVFSANAMTTGQPESVPPDAAQAADASPTADNASPHPNDEVAELRQRLALIEGSRTWKLRTKLARLLPTRH